MGMSAIFFAASCRHVQTRAKSPLIISVLCLSTIAALMYSRNSKRRSSASNVSQILMQSGISRS